ncbi:hypothetical protein RUM43_001747 [Polyplax serrata]|uniref:G-protein coupled receptors family 1 profile domain-containing protein n=1 Tax=Polyplax serrata TaxID=468196 RepID=A0AAN8SK48_POLSC
MSMPWKFSKEAVTNLVDTSRSDMKFNYNTTEPVYSFQHSLDHNEDVQKDREVSDQVVAWALIDGFLFLAIVSGNVLTIAAILMNRGISHNVSNHFILSLACSDLFVGLILPYHMMFYIQPELSQIFGFCIARLGLLSLVCTASVMNIIGIAVDRFIAIVYPLHYHKVMTKRLARGLVVIGWILAVSISVIPVFWNKWEQNVRNKKSKGKCELGYIVEPLYVKTIYLPCFVLLFTIMCGFYVKIFAETRKHAKRMRRVKNDPPDTWKSLQVLMLVMGSFTISYMPFIIVVILNTIFQYHTETTSLLYKITISLAVSNSAINPLIYAWKNQEFKKAFWKILNCKSIEGNSFELPAGLRRFGRSIIHKSSVTPETKTATNNFEKI